MENEKRLHKRLALSLPIYYEVLEKDKKEIGDTVCKDVSEGGIKLMLKKFYPPKTKFLLKINLEGINRIIETIAESIWSFNTHFSNNYYNGLRFTDLNISNQNTLGEYITIKGITEDKI